MEKLIKRFLYLPLVCLLILSTTAQRADAQDVNVSYQNFYDNLSPYGQWVNDPQYGNVFVPNEGGDFRPYGSRGHWVMTDYGNTWVSEDPWGWACYHYGRWTYNPYYGWVWIPGYEWAPAWVSWRFGGGNCGWAPLGPGSSPGGYNCPDSWWVFVGPQYMYRPDCFHYWRGEQYNTGYLRQTTIVNNYYVDNSSHVQYNYGPRAEAIQQVTHQPVQVYRVSQSTRPGAPSVGERTVSIYRPGVERNTVSSARPANVIQAPHALGKPQPANTANNARQPQFRQDLPHLAASRGNTPSPAINGRQQSAPNAPVNNTAGRQPVNNSQQPSGRQQLTNQQPASRPQNTVNQPNVRNNQMGQPEPQQRNQNQPQTQPNRPEPQRFQPQQPTQPQRFQQSQTQQLQQPQSQPQPQRFQPQPQSQSQPQRPQPEPQRQQPQPQMNRPEPQQRSTPQPQAPRQAPAPREQHEGGRR